MRATHQTVRLSRGRHRSADHGTCVVELTSMLAGERFSDHPRCACPALTAFLRGYNDAIDKRQRQDLYAIASELVGTRADEATSTARGERLVELAWRYERRVGPIVLTPDVNFPIRFDRYQGAGLHLGKCARRSKDCHKAVIALLLELVATPINRENESRLRDRTWRPGPPPLREEVPQQLRTLVR